MQRGKSCVVEPRLRQWAGQTRAKERDDVRDTKPRATGQTIYFMGFPRVDERASPFNARLCVHESYISERGYIRGSDVGMRGRHTPGLHKGHIMCVAMCIRRNATA